MNKVSGDKMNKVKEKQSPSVDQERIYREIKAKRLKEKEEACDLAQRLWQKRGAK